MAYSSSSCSETLKKCPSVLVSNELMQLIKDPVEGKGASSPSLHAHFTTMDELLMSMKNYIVKHNLYDPKNPLKIVVHDTELGSLLGKSEFSLLDVKDILLQKFVFPVPEKNLSEVICSISDKMCVSKKIKLENGSEISTKMIKGIERNDRHCDSDESIYSVQGYETEFVKDDSFSEDNFSDNGLIIAETIGADVEYEIETDSSDFSCESDSDIEDFVKSTVLSFIAHSSHSDIEYLADRSSDETESEPELSEEDKWHCSSCLTLNDAFMRHCAACWQTRVGWLCERSEQKNESEEQSKSKQKASARKRRKLSKKYSKNKGSSNYKLSDLPSAAREISPSPSSSCKDNTDVFQSPPNTLKAGKDCIQTKLDEQLCLFCCAKPVDSSFIHGKVGCKVSCYRCGKKLMNANKPCPVCRQNIERIVYLSYA